jgi:hypothetical protein
MKKLLALSMLIPLMICSCQKQDAAAEQQLTQRKVDLDSREKALDEREKALEEREKAVARAAMIPSDVQLRALKRESSSNQRPAGPAPPGLAPPVNADLKAQREQRIQQLRALRQGRMEALRGMRGTGAQASPNVQAPADTAAPSGAEGSSPSPSATPQ